LDVARQILAALYCALAEARPKLPLTLPSITRVLRVD
jgi:hypothetical protein